MLTKVTDDVKQAVNKWLVEKSLTLREAATLLGCSHGAIGNIAKGTTEAIRTKLMIDLEPHINKYIDPAELQKEIGGKVSSIPHDVGNLCSFDVSIITNIQNYKKDNNLSYDDLGAQYNIPLLKLVEWLEADYTGKDTFNVPTSDWPLFASFVSQVFSAQS